MTHTYDVIVLGLGGMGSATVAHLARRGVSVLGLEAFARRHTFGSSHGRSRIIREAYLEDPDYVPLVQRAYALWRDLEQESEQHLLTITGGLNMGAPDSEFVTGAAESAKQHGLAAERLTAREVSERFPGFNLPDDYLAVFEPNAGFLRPEECNEAHLMVAERYGADLHFDEPVTQWKADGDSVTVETSQKTYVANRLIITAGPWTSDVLPDLAPRLTVQRVVNAHFEPSRPEMFGPDVCPVYLFQVPEGDFYGFPALPGEGVKIGRHDVGEICTPQTIRRDIDTEEIEELRTVLDRYLPGASGEVKATLTCMYTNTPDHNFIIDRHPKHPQVVVGCGFSGHGFKFASVIGEVLADLSLNGSTRHAVEFLSLDRFSASSSVQY